MLRQGLRRGHRWYHGGRYGFNSPYPELLLPGDTAWGGPFGYRYPYFSLYHRTTPGPYDSEVEEESLAIGLVGGAGIRDAEEILLRAGEDERDAIEARNRYRTDGLPVLLVDGHVADRLRPGETVIDARPSSVVSRHLNGDGTDDFPGRLYLTTERLMIVGHVPLDVELGEIDELALAGERLLVTLRDGTGLAIDAARPRLMRVQIAAALAAGRS